MMRPTSRLLGASIAGFGVALAASLAGCALLSPPDLPASAGLQCVDDSVECISRRQAALRQLVSDKDRKWVKEPATAEAYASGVRLFAFKSKKRELTCEELQHGRKEADAAPASLRGAQGTLLTPAQVARGTILAAEVSRELGNEFSRRCKKA